MFKFGERNNILKVQKMVWSCLMFVSGRVITVRGVEKNVGLCVKERKRFGGEWTGISSGTCGVVESIWS